MVESSSVLLEVVIECATNLVNSIQTVQSFFVGKQMKHYTCATYSDL